MSFFAARDLHVRLDGFRLQGVSFELGQGDYLGVLGPSGSGKSVLLDTIAGYHDAQAGTITLGGSEVSGLPPERRGIGVVYQDYALFPHLTAFENIAYGLRVRERDDGVVNERVAAMAESLGLARVLGKRPQFLSGGEQQRTALARALVVRPQLLVMDEPFSALDPPTRSELRSVVRALTREAGITVVHVAHDLEDTLALADKALVLREGVVEAFGPLNDVLGPPAVPFLRQVQGVRVVNGQVVERHDGVGFVETGGVRLATSDPAEPGAAVRVVLRPADVTLHVERPVGTSARNVLPCILNGCHADGGTVLVGLRCARLDFNARLTAEAVRALELPARDKVFATIKAVHLNIV